jgi:hypothetical protein
MNETMTKREQIAAMMMAALVARCGNASAGRLASDATNYADALIVELKCSDGIKYELTPSQIEKMLSDTIPGGSVADPQEIADAIREWFGYSSDDLKKTPCSAFELRGTSIHNARTGKIICTIWPERKVSDEREEGESWLAMRQRTEPEREAIQRHTEQRAASICDFLNSQNAVVTHVRNEH